MLLIFAALQEEASGILRAGNAREVPTPDGFQAYSGEFNHERTASEFTVVVSGVGPDRAVEASKWAIENVSDPMVVVTGFAGGTSRELGKGDLVIPATVSSIEGSPITWESRGISRTLTPDADMMTCARIVVETTGVDSTSGLLVSLPSIARTANMKSWIGDRLGAAAVDLESHVVCSVAAEAGVPFLVVRSVVDAVDFDLPQLVTEIPGGSSDRRFWPAIRYVARRPWQLPTMFDLYEAARAARANLTGFCREFSSRMDDMTAYPSDSGVAA